MSCQLKHLFLIPAGIEEWLSTYSVDKKEAYRLSLEKLYTIILGIFEKYKIPYLTTYLPDMRKMDNDLISLAQEFLKKLARKVNIDVRSVARMPEVFTKILKERQNNIEHNKCKCLVLYRYDPEEEIINACKKICTISEKKGYLEIITLFNSFLLTHDLPEIDLLIKTKGKAKIPIWQSSYAEIYLINKYWPEVCFEEIERGIQDFFKRKRRFGK